MMNALINVVVDGSWSSAIASRINLTCAFSGLVPRISCVDS